MIGFVGTPLLMPGQTPEVGASAGGEFRHGAINDVFVYGRPLTAAEVALNPARSILPAGSAVSASGGATLDVNKTTDAVASLSAASGATVNMGTGSLTTTGAATLGRGASYSVHVTGVVNIPTSVTIITNGAITESGGGAVTTAPDDQLGRRDGPRRGERGGLVHRDELHERQHHPDEYQRDVRHHRDQRHGRHHDGDRHRQHDRLRDRDHVHRGGAGAHDGEPDRLLGGGGVRWGPPRLRCG